MSPDLFNVGLVGLLKQKPHLLWAASILNFLGYVPLFGAMVRIDPDDSNSETSGNGGLTIDELSPQPQDQIQVEINKGDHVFDPDNGSGVVDTVERNPDRTTLLLKIQFDQNPPGILSVISPDRMKKLKFIPSDQVEDFLEKQLTFVNQLQEEFWLLGVHLTLEELDRLKSILHCPDQ